MKIIIKTTTAKEIFDGAIFRETEKYEKCVSSAKKTAKKNLEQWKDIQYFNFHPHDVYAKMPHLFDRPPGMLKQFCCRLFNLNPRLPKETISRLIDENSGIFTPPAAPPPHLHTLQSLRFLAEIHTDPTICLDETDISAVIKTF